MNKTRVLNLLTFYLPFLILGAFLYGIINRNSQTAVYALAYLVTYLAIRLEIHHYAHKWPLHRDAEFVKNLVVSELLLLGFLLPTVFAHTTRADFTRNIIIFFIAGILIYIVARTINRLLERGLLIVSLGLLLVIFMTTRSIVEPAIFALLSLWTYLVLKHSLVVYA